MAKFWDTKFGSKLKGAGNWILNTLDESTDTQSSC